MTMQAVESSNVAGVGYDPETQTLRVEFKNGGVYEKDEVSPEEHAALLSADSVGRHFQQHFRSGMTRKL